MDAVLHTYIWMLGYPWISKVVHGECVYEIITGLKEKRGCNGVG